MENRRRSLWLIMLISLLCNNAIAQKNKKVRTNLVNICVILQKDNTCSISYWGDKGNSYGYEYIGKVIIPKTIEYGGKTYTVTSIGANAFSDCSYLMSVEVPNTVTTIGEKAFANCLNLEHVNIPTSISSIGSKAFYKCPNLKDLHIPASVTSIGRKAFYGCKSLYPIDEPSNAYYIGKLAFGDSPAKDMRHSSRMPHPEDIAPAKDIAEQPATKSPNPPAKAIDSKGEGTTIEVQPAKNIKAFPIVNISNVTFVDNGNNMIEAYESCKVKIKVTNSGKGVAVGCIAKLDINGVEGLAAKAVKLPNIEPGETVDATLDLKADGQLKDGKANIMVAVDEPNGFGCNPTMLSVATQAFVAPNVLISDYSVTSELGSSLEKRVPFDLQILVQNVSHGAADDVNINISVPQNVFITEGKQHTHISKLSGGDTQQIVYSLIVNNNYTDTTIPIQFTLRERHGLYAENRTINLSINQSLAQNKIEVTGNVDIPESSKGNIAIAKIEGATKQADVDISIPVIDITNDKTFAVIIANENYRKESPVKFATNDGNIVCQYMTKTLGLPKENVHTVIDATLNEIRDQIDWLKRVAIAYGGEASIIVYYAGHGMPNEASGQSYLIPSDGNSTNPASCIALNDFYEELANMNVKRTCVFLDACFSGAQRGDGMLMAARGVAIKPKNNVLKGNLVVFSAAQGTETAYPYTEMRHGLFTYYMLKALQQSQGYMPLGELDEFITTEVSRRSIVVNSKSQTPVTAVSAAVGDEWKTWRLK